MINASTNFTKIEFKKYWRNHSKICYKIYNELHCMSNFFLKFIIFKIKRVTSVCQICGLGNQELIIIFSIEISLKKPIKEDSVYKLGAIDLEFHDTIWFPYRVYWLNNIFQLKILHNYYNDNNLKKIWWFLNNLHENKFKWSWGKIIYEDIEIDELLIFLFE